MSVFICILVIWLVLIVRGVDANYVDHYGRCLDE